MGRKIHLDTQHVSVFLGGLLQVWHRDRNMIQAADTVWAEVAWRRTGTVWAEVTGRRTGSEAAAAAAAAAAPAPHSLQWCRAGPRPRHVSRCAHSVAQPCDAQTPGKTSTQSPPGLRLPCAAPPGWLQPASVALDHISWEQNASQPAVRGFVQLWPKVWTWAGSRGASVYTMHVLTQLVRNPPFLLWICGVCAIANRGKALPYESYHDASLLGPPAASLHDCSSSGVCCTIIRQQRWVQGY